MRYDVGQARLSKTKHMLLDNGIDIPTNDIKILCGNFKDDSDILYHAPEYLFDNKIKRWYDGTTKLYNTDKFRPAALYYQEHGVYTKAKKNRHPRSEYKKYWDEQFRRCKYGYHIGDMWITGYHYWFLNFCKIERNVEVIENGEVKTVREYDFPSFWDGHYYMFHYIEEARRLKKHCVILKKRGFGFSWILAAMNACNYYIYPRSRSLIYADNYEYLTGNDGLMTKIQALMMFIDVETPFVKRKITNTKKEIRSGFKYKGEDQIEKEGGFRSEIAAISLKDNPHKARGKRSMLISIEEFGSLDNGEHAWTVATPSVEQGQGKRKQVFGIMIAGGTGGETGSSFKAMKAMIYKPSIYNILSVPNLWDTNAKAQRVGFFVPQYVNMTGYMDKYGNSDMVNAKEELLELRKEWKELNIDPVQYSRNCAERPLNIQEAILRTGGNVFPTADLKERLGKLETSDKLYHNRYVGDLILKGGNKVEWKEDVSKDAKPIESITPLTEATEGKIVLWEKPAQTNEGVISSRYIGGCDPIEYGRKEVGEKYSFGVTYIFDTWFQRIVAEYVARPMKEDVFFENTRRLALYYNAEINYENNLKGIYRHFMAMNSVEYLSNEPKHVRDKLDMKSTAQRPKGTTASKKINDYALTRIKSWLLRTQTNDNALLNMDTIRSKGLLEEMINWNMDGNFDRISALGMVMILFDEYDIMEDIGFQDDNDIAKCEYWSAYV